MQNLSSPAHLLTCSSARRTALRSMSRGRLRLEIPFVLIILCAGIFGCASNRTLPPTDGEQMLDASLPPTPEIIELAIVAAHRRGTSNEQPIIFNLPPGVQKSTWRRVTERLGEGARPMQPGDVNVTSVERIRVDGGRARVDVLIPRGTAYQLFTIHLRGGGLAGWRVDYVQPWTLHVDPPVSHSPWNAAPADPV